MAVRTLVTMLVAGSALAGWLPVAGGSGSPAVTILEQSAARTVFEVTVPGLEETRVVVEGEEFTQLSLPGEVMAVLDEGKPQMPKVSVLLAIPGGARVSARATVLETRTFRVGSVYPLQPPLLECEEPAPFTIDRGFYAQDAAYPGRDVALIETGVWRDLDVANLQVYPAQVNPARGEVTVAARVRVEVDYAGGSYPAVISDAFVPQYADFIDNFAELRIPVQADYADGVRYLVLCHSSWATNSYLVDSLLGWVKQRGYDVRMITKSSFSYAEVKDSIRAEYNRNTPPTLQYVLLVGEYAQIPTGTYSGVGKSDFYYMDLLPSPTGDNYPEVSAARFSPASATDLENQIKKSLKYQKNPATTNNWLEKLTMVAHREQYPAKYSGCVRGAYHMPKPFWQPTLDTIMGQFLGNAAVTSAVNSGVGILAYRGHGDATEWWSWCADGSWYNSHVTSLANGDLTPVTQHWACICGDISFAECHAEAWMRKYPGGAVSALGATQASYTLPNHGQCSTVVRATCDTWTITVPGVRDYRGPVFNVADQMSYMDAYVAKYWPTSPYFYNIWMYLTLGDPAMPVWAGGMPQTATVGAPDSIPLGPYTMNVTVQVGGRPVAGALVCAWKDGDFYTAERTDGTGLASLEVNAGTPGDVMLTVSEGHAATLPHTPILPYETTVPAGGGGTPQPNMRYVSNLVDDSGGNNNGRFDPGETANILVTVRNAGNAQADNVTAVLRSGHAQFVISDPNAVYGNVPQGEERTNTSDPFTATAGSGIPGGTMVPCTLHLHSDNWGDWTYTFSLQVGQPATPGQLLMTHDTGYCKLTVSCQGSIGYDAAADAGEGFSYPKTAASALFYGSFAVGNAEGYVADRHFGQPASGAQNSDLVPVDSLRPVTPPLAGDEHFRGSYSDAGHPGPKQLKIIQNSHQVAGSGYDDFVVLTFDIRNDGSSAVNGLYAGVFADFDIGTTPTTNVCSTDVSRRLTFMRQSSSANPSVGVVILDPTSAANLSAVDHARFVYPDSAMTDGMKWRFLNGTVTLPNSNRAYDWSTVTSVGPFDLGAGASYRFAVAFVGGASGTEIRTNADSAQAWYGTVGVVEPRVEAGRLEGIVCRPNPFARTVSISMQLPVAGRVKMQVFDVSGRAVGTLVDGERAAGRLETVWSPDGLANGVYLLKAELPDGTRTEKLMLLR